MKKNTILSIMTCAVMLLLTAACSNDENSNPKEQPTQAVQFSFTNEDFGADETLSRATGAAETKPQTVDLGDCEAEISVENEPAVKTRGTMTNANGHYTIRAYQGGTLKGEMKGTFSGGAFTPDATSPQEIGLSAGTYDFIAFNDDVIPSGNDLTVDRTKAETARMGTTTANITATPQKQKVMFTMKHVGCRLRTQIVCQKHIPETITATLKQTAANVIPTIVAYSPATKSFTATNGSMTTEANNSPASTETKYTASNYGQNYAYTSTSSTYHYFLPITEASKLKLNFSGGTIFLKPLIGTIPLLDVTLSMQAGKSYLVKIKVKPQFTYLMSDGSIGHFRNTTFGGGSKTPIAVVVSQSKHLAISLQDANGGNSCYWTDNFAHYTMNQVNTDMKTTFSDAWALEDGYEETWDGNYSTAIVTGEKVKGKRADFPAFKACADYSPGVIVTGANVSKWYLPAFGEWKYIFTTLGFDDSSLITTWGSYNSYSYLTNSAFTQVGGTIIYGDNFYWSSSEILSSNACHFGSDAQFSHRPYMYVDYRTKAIPLYVRPFVKY